MEFLTFLVEWGTMVTAGAVVCVTVLGISWIVKGIISRKAVSQ